MSQGAAPRPAPAARLASGDELRPRSESLGSAARLHAQRDFEALRRHGMLARRVCVRVFFSENTGTGARLGLSVGRKLGGAVRRNRLKRVVREVFRRRRDLRRLAVDVLVQALPAPGSPASGGEAREWDALFRRELEDAFSEVCARLRREWPGGRQNSPQGLSVGG